MARSGQRFSLLDDARVEVKSLMSLTSTTVDCTFEILYELQLASIMAQCLQTKPFLGLGRAAGGRGGGFEISFYLFIFNCGRSNCTREVTEAR